ncbi:MAG: cyclic-di-AMP receptor [bacterium]|jgi:uncharacterized protein YaaQ
MKLVIAIIQDTDAGRLAEALAKEDIRSTKLASTGGFLGRGNTTIMIGTEDEKVEAVLAVIRGACLSRRQTVTPVAPVGATPGSFIPIPLEVTVGGATVFVLTADKFVKV